MKYYLHDSNAFNDEKITQLFMKFGYEGLGLFYTALEKLAAQEKPIVTTVLKHQLKVGKKLEKCWSFMEEIDILSSNNGETFNKQLLNFSEKYKIKSEKNKKRVSEWRDKQEVTENVTHYESVRNTPKVKESKVNINTYVGNECIEKTIQEILTYFAIDDNPSNHLKHALVTKMVSTLFANNLIETLNTQFANYQRYKKEANEKVHGLNVFCGTQENKFLDGAWNIENWSNKLRTYKQQQNGKATIQEQKPDFNEFRNLRRSTTTE